MHKAVAALSTIVVIGIAFVAYFSELQGVIPWLPSHQRFKERKEEQTSIASNTKIDYNKSVSHAAKDDKKIPHDFLVDPCSCWNSTATPKCCKRFLLRYHKMGHELLTKLRNDYGLKQVELGGKSELHTKGDFRAVAAIRNFYDSIVSGYLYHKSGRECWLSMYGEPVKKSKMFASRRKWPKAIFNAAPHAPSKGRNLCEYLRDESEQDGIRVMTELYFTRWTANLMPRLEQSQQKDSEWFGRFQHVCYEDLVNPDTELTTMQSVVDMLWPAGDQTAFRKKQSRSKGQGGGHATSHDSQLRSRLRGLVEAFDKEYFNETVAWHQQTFRCGDN